MAAAYAFGRTVPLPFAQAIERVTAALAAEGFGVLTEIDVSATLQRKLGETIPPYRILGACNPQFAHRALTIEPQIGALLPCNVIVREDASGAVHVEFMDPDAVLGLVGRAEVEPIASEVRTRLQRVMAAL
jgi:uncharacterized protein (DUF302 family)